MKYFCGHRRINLLAVFFTFVIIQRIDGYPRPWTLFISYAVKQPSTEASSYNIGKSSGISDVLRETTTTTAEITAFHNLQPLSAYIESQDVSEILKISKQKRTIRLEDTSSDEDPNKAKYEEDEEIDKELDNEDEALDKEIDNGDEELDKEINNEDEGLDKEKPDEDEELDTEVDNNNDNTTKTIEFNANCTKDNDNDILIDEALRNKVYISPKEFDSAMQNSENNDPENIDADGLIFDAIKDNIFLTPEEFEMAKKNEDGIDTTTKKYENRPPRNPNVVTSPTWSSNDDRIVSPGLAPTKYLDDFARLPVPSCNGSTFCENLPYYPPDELVENALRINYIEPFSDPSTLTQRMGPLEPDGSREESLCFSEKKEIKPESGLDENKEWHYIINNGKYEQKIEIELCSNEGDSCRLIDPPASGYRTFCKQKYVYRHLVTITPNGTTASKSIRLPSSCCCHVKFSTNITSRMGGGLQKENQRGPKLSLLPRPDN